MMSIRISSLETCMMPCLVTPVAQCKKLLSELKILCIHKHFNCRCSLSLVFLHFCRYSERSKTKCIGITIETRPDYCLKKHLRYTHTHTHTHKAYPHMTNSYLINFPPNQQIAMTYSLHTVKCCHTDVPD